MLKSLFKRSGIYFSGLIIGKFLSTLIFILFARILLPSAFGDFVLFITLIQTVTFFADFGLNQWYQKYASVEDKNHLYSRVITARIVSLLIFFIIAGLFLLYVPSFTPYISILLLLSLIPDAFLSIIDGYYLEKKLPLKVSLKVIYRMLFLLCFFLFYIKSFSLEIAITGYFISSMLTLILLFPWHMFRFLSSNNFKNSFKTLNSSKSYALLILTSFMYSRGDTLVIRYSLNSTALGLYGAAYRFLESLSLLPTALSHNLFPISARKQGIRLSSLYKIIIFMTILGIIVSLLLFIFSDWLIIFLLGKEYFSAIPLLKVFSAVLLLFFINAPLSTVVQSSSLLNKFLPFGIANTVLNILLNISLVPFFGIIIASWVMLCTEFLGLLINIYFVKSYYKYG